MLDFNWAIERNGWNVVLLSSAKKILHVVYIASFSIPNKNCKIIENAVYIKCIEDITSCAFDTFDISFWNVG